MQPIAADRIDHIHLTRQLTSPGEPYPFFASVSRGEFVALFRGVYIRAPLGNAMSLDDRYRARVKAASLVVPPDTVFSHHSAAALCGYRSHALWRTRQRALLSRLVSLWRMLRCAEQCIL